MLRVSLVIRMCKYLFRNEMKSLFYFREQDSQEFLRYFLQGLSEDVNRIRQKPVPIIIDEKEEERKK